MSRSRFYQAGFACGLLVTLISLAAPSAVRAAPMFIPGVAFSPTNVGNNAIQIGSRVQMTNAASAYAVGVYVEANVANPYVTAGVTNVNFTGLLYDASLNLIESVLIPIGSAVDAQGFAYANFTSAHTLAIGQQYVITAWKGIPTVSAREVWDFWEKTPEHATINSATLVESVYGFTTGAPSNNFTGYNEFGPNLQITVPEPASLGLLSIGGLILLRRRRA